MATETKQLKSLLHESIENIDDEETLRLAKNIFERKYSPPENVKPNAYQLKRLNKAKKSIENGDYLTNEQVDEIVKKWLNE